MLNERAIEFASEGSTLRGVLITPAQAEAPLPTVILAHGTSATFRMVAIEYAREFARHGFALSQGAIAGRMGGSSEERGVRCFSSAR